VSTAVHVLLPSLLPSCTILTPTPPCSIPKGSSSSRQQRSSRQVAWRVHRRARGHHMAPPGVPAARRQHHTNGQQ
jgi:hypothetical protein